MSNCFWIYISVLLKYFPHFHPPLKEYLLAEVLWFPSPSETHPMYLTVKQATLLTCLPVTLSGGVKPWFPGPTKEREGSIKVMKVLFPAKHATCSRADFESSSHKELHCDSPNGLFLFAENLPLSGALASERFLQIHWDVHPSRLCTFLHDFVSSFKGF